MKNKASILLSIFKRKGGEGLHTKIIDDNNRTQYENPFLPLEEGEKGIIVYFQDELNQFLLTNNRLISIINGISFIILNVNLVEVMPALQEEFKNYITNSLKFTRLLIKDRYNNEYILRVEEGKAYQGVFQVLHFIASGNSGK